MPLHEGLVHVQVLAPFMAVLAIRITAYRGLHCILLPPKMEISIQGKVIFFSTGVRLSATSALFFLGRHQEFEVLARRNPATWPVHRKDLHCIGTCAAVAPSTTCRLNANDLQLAPC